MTIWKWLSLYIHLWTFMYFTYFNANLFKWLKMLFFSPRIIKSTQQTPSLFLFFCLFLVFIPLRINLEQDFSLSLVGQLWWNADESDYEKDFKRFWNILGVVSETNSNIGSLCWVHKVFCLWERKCSWDNNSRMTLDYIVSFVPSSKFFLSISRPLCHILPGII